MPDHRDDALLCHTMLEQWMLQTLDHAVIFLDSDGLVVGCNAAVERVLGYTLDTWRGQSLSIIFTPEDRARGLDVHEMEVARQVGRADDDRWHLRRNGTPVWIGGVLRSIVGDDGQRIGFMKVLRDRTDLRTQMDAIENRLAEAEKALQRKDAFIAAVGHEMRNPLGALSNSVALLKYEQPAIANSQATAIIDRQLKAMGRMVDDLLDATQINIGALRLNLADVDVGGAIRSAVALHSGAAQARQHTVTVVVPPVPIILQADPGRLEQVLRNLLDNAIKYTPPGGTLSVTATVEWPMVVIRVRDNGQGLSADSLPRIFEMFSREQSAISSGAGGLGIGLALAKNLVQLHHGTIEVQSDGPGYGSEFKVNLPMRTDVPRSTHP